MKQPIKFQKAYHPHPRVQVQNEHPTITEQSHKDQCDVNRIIEKFGRTGVIEHAAKYAGQYDDVPAIDFQDAMFTIVKAETMFNELPSAIRKRFHDQPGEFLQFVENPENADELRALGLAHGVDGKRADGTPINPPATAAQPSTTPEAPPKAPEPGA